VSAKSVSSKDLTIASILDGAEVWLMLLDNRMRVTEVSRALHQRLGLNADAMCGKKLSALVYSEDLPRVERLLAPETLISRGSIAVDCRLADGRGGAVWMQLSISPIASEGGETHGLIAQVTEIDTLKRSEIESNALQRRWNLAMEGASQGVWDQDIITGKFFFSPAWYRLRGLDPGSTQRDAFEDWITFVHPDDRQFVTDQVKLLESGKAGETDYEYRERHEDGHWIWVLARGRWVEWTEDGRPKRIVGTDTDITDLKQAQEEIRRLAHRELRWKIAVESTEQGLWDIDVKAGTNFYSDSWCRMRGRKLNDTSGQHPSEWLDRVHPDDREHVLEQVRRHNAGEVDTIRFEYRERRTDGEWMWVLARGKAVTLDENGVPTRIIGTDTDITDLKQRETDLARLSRRLEVALEASGLGVWEANLAESSVYWDARMIAIYGIDLAPGIVPEGSWEALLHPDDRDQAKKVTETAIANKAPLHNQFRVVRPDGSVRIVRSWASYEEDSAGRGRLIGASADVTEVMQREEELARLSTRLEVALSASGLGVWEVDLDNRTSVWDAGMMEIFGFDRPPGQVRDGVFESAIHPDDRSVAIARVEHALRTGEALKSEFRIVRADAEIRHVRARANTYVNNEGRRMFVGANGDVTDEFMQAEALRAANALSERRNRELEAARAEMEHNSLHDPLTGLPNRRYLDGILGDESRQADQGMALLHIDLDRFKQINDTLGHAAGDATLQHVGALLRRTVRQEDLVARIGGDEFVVVMSPAPSSDQIENLATRIISSVSRPFEYDGLECLTGASVGIAVSDRKDVDFRQLWVDADIALYRAKRDGRNRFVFFTGELQAEIFATKRCADQIVRGLERSEFEPVFQPQVVAGTLELAGVEALARWHHPDDGVLTPDRFLPVAEDLHVVASIDGMILEKSLASLALWDAQGFVVPRVSVNVSARRLRDDHLISKLHRMDIAPGRISFELLESIFLDEDDAVVSWNIDQIRDLGINIDIDDFGTGHASIVGLLKLSPHRLKIDRQLVQPIVHSAQQRHMVKSIIEIGRSQNIEVVAEGVETQRHADILTDLGCDVLQGYFFGRPMTAEKLTEYLIEGPWRKAS
jgi:diguanylate cyclase (GGDEF)-like protein/PAS domain S-box-containing protein